MFPLTPTLSSSDARRGGVKAESELRNSLLTQNFFTQILEGDELGNKSAHRDAKSSTAQQLLLASWSNPHHSGKGGPTGGWDTQEAAPAVQQQWGDELAEAHTATPLRGRVEKPTTHLYTPGYNADAHKVIRVCPGTPNTPCVHAYARH